MYRFLDFADSPVPHVFNHAAICGSVARSVFQVVETNEDYYRTERDICVKSYICTRQDRMPDMYIEAEELIIPKMPITSLPGQLGFNEDLIALRLLSHAVPIEHTQMVRRGTPNWGLAEDLTITRHKLLEHELDVVNAICYKYDAKYLTPLLGEMWPHVKVTSSQLAVPGAIYLTAKPEILGKLVDYGGLRFVDEGREARDVGMAVINDWACARLDFELERGQHVPIHAL